MKEAGIVRRKKMRKKMTLQHFFAIQRGSDYADLEINKIGFECV